MTTAQNRPLLGSAFMVAAMIVFATQDGLSKMLAAEYNPIFITILRYWAFAVFALIFTSAAPGGLKRGVRTKKLLVQVFRGALLAIEICIIVFSFVHLGLVQTHAVFALTPLLTTAFAAIFLKERSDLIQWLLIGMGLVGVLIILQPGTGVFNPLALIPLGGAFLFAIYATTTRWVGQIDGSTTSFFYLGVAGAVVITCAAPFFWEDMRGTDWLYMLALSICGAGSHWLLIKAYEVSAPAPLQPFAYMQTTLAAVIGVVFFAEKIETALLIGAAIVVVSGVLCLTRNALQRKR